MAPMKVEIITAERVVYSEDVDVVVAPGIEGELGILPHHAPLMTTLQSGEIRVRKGGEEISMAVSGGFLEVMANKVTILADSAERAEEIDEARAQEAMRRAEERLRTHASDVDLERAVAALRRSQARLKVARRRRTRPSPPQV
ncbi:MAG: atpC [Dehalococcoidia bacterium]|nr:atpC [Dehalococcoidia bacterium]